jgi:hypothetical protein
VSPGTPGLSAAANLVGAVSAPPLTSSRPNLTTRIAETHISPPVLSIDNAGLTAILAALDTVFSDSVEMTTFAGDELSPLPPKSPTVQEAARSVGPAPAAPPQPIQTPRPAEDVELFAPWNGECADEDQR